MATPYPLINPINAPDYCTCSRGTLAEQHAAKSKRDWTVGNLRICLVHDTMLFRETPGDVTETELQLPGLEKSTLKMTLKPEVIEKALASGAKKVMRPVEK